MDWSKFNSNINNNSSWANIDTTKSMWPKVETTETKTFNLKPFKFTEESNESENSPNTPLIKPFKFGAETIQLEKSNKFSEEKNEVENTDNTNNTKSNKFEEEPDTLEQTIRGKFQKKCLLMYRDIMEKSLIEMNKQFNDELKNTISKNNSSKKLYDYSEISDIFCNISNTHERYNLSYQDDINKFINHSLSGIISTFQTIYNKDDVIRKFSQLEKNEKIILLHQNRTVEKCVYNDFQQISNLPDFVYSLVIVTNYSRVLVIKIDKNFNSNNHHIILYEEFNFWIPIDYIRLLKIIIINGGNYLKEEIEYIIPGNPYLGTIIDPRLIYSILSIMKNLLYNRTYLPEHVIEEMEKNKYELYKLYEDYNYEVSEKNKLKEEVSELKLRLKKIEDTFKQSKKQLGEITNMF